MLEKLIQKVTGKDCELQERMLRTIILVGGIAVLIAITEIILVMDIKANMVLMLVLLLLSMAAAFVVTFKYRKYNAASTLLGIVIIVLVMPFMFILSAAIDSGASVWLSLGILYIFIMFSGKKLLLFFGLTVISYGVTFWLAYTYPELIVPMPTRATSYFDAFFSVFAVGMVGGGILKAHMRVYEEEHRLNIEQKEELEKSRDSQNTFFANMSHEIRTPINAILGLNEMIMRTAPAKEIQEYSKDIQMAGNLLLNQVNDILDLSQMSMDKMQINPGKYYTRDLFADLVDLIKVQADKKNLDLIMNIDKNLPSELMGDEKRLKQVLINIMDNAVKYTEEGSVTVTVEGEEYVNDEVLLSIKIADTGIGIRKENLADIYDSFNRFDENKNKRILGSGLGLAITKQLVEMMGGEIQVDSIYTKGTIFTVLIRQKIMNTEPVGEINFAYKGMEEGTVYRPLFEAPEARVLIVDDNKMNRVVAAKLLEATKMQVDMAASGAECLEMAKKKFYHVILLDYMMPDMDGLETLRELNAQENGLCRDSAVILLTGNAQSGARQMYMDEGFDGYVEKPIQGRLLESEIFSFLPADIIEYQEDAKLHAENMGQMQKLSMRKRKKIYITTDCTCDIPSELLEKYDIKLMYLYIKTPYGRFADTREIDSDSLAQYVSLENSTAKGDSVTVEEIEEFFAEALTQAEHVIHISLSSKCGRSHSVAVAAAEGFDHVHVIDSGQISCGQGLVVLYAAKLAMEGKTPTEICELVNKMKHRVHTRFIMPSADIFYQNGRTSAFAAKMCRVLHLHPYAGLIQKKALLRGLLFGSLENAWRQGIHIMLRKKRRINKDIVFVTHVGCSVKQQEWLKREIAKYVKFDRVIIQKASFTSACNVGMECIGIAYYSE